MGAASKIINSIEIDGELYPFTPESPDHKKWVEIIQDHIMIETVGRYKRRDVTA